MNFYISAAHQAMNNQMPMAVWRAGMDKIEAAARLWVCFAWTTANALPTYPQQNQQEAALKDNGRRDYTLNSTTLGPTNGVQFNSGNQAQSRFNGTKETYASVHSAQPGDAGSSSYQAQADLDSVDRPHQRRQLFVTTAEAKALGLMTGTGLDGAVGLSSAYSFDYNAPTTPVAAGQYDAIGALEHVKSAK